MKHFLFTLMFVLAMTVNAVAAGFSIGDAKYEILPDGSVELKDFKKATNDVVIPEKITDPKTGTEYRVSAIGDRAFKKAPVKTVVLPASVSSIGKQAFMDCAELTSVKISGTISEIPQECFRNCSAMNNLDMNLGKLKEVGWNAFINCGIGSIDPIMYYIYRSHVLPLWGIVPKGHKGKFESSPIVIGTDVDKKTVQTFMEGKTNPIIIFEDKYAGSQAFDVFGALGRNEMFYTGDVKRYYEHPDECKDLFGNLRPLKDYMASQLSRYNTLKHPTFSAFFGLSEDGTFSPLQELPYDAIKAYETAGENLEREKFLAKMETLVSNAMKETPYIANDLYDIPESQKWKYNDLVKPIVQNLCDSVYLVKPELNTNAAEVLKSFIFMQFNSIGVDLDVHGLSLDKYADNDILAKDTQYGGHKEEYERILKCIDRWKGGGGLIQSKGEEYRILGIQIASLCGNGMWKEAAGYFPKLLNHWYKGSGTTTPSKFLEYIHKKLGEQGYQLSLAPQKKKTSKSSNVQSSDNSDVFEFFMEAAINAGIDHYKKKKAKKEARELYYESIGLDKKGRPKK